MMDMHSGGQQEPLTPCLFYPLAEAVTEEALVPARALDIPWLIASTATAGQYSYAANYHKVPGLLVERGYGGFCKKGMGRRLLQRYFPAFEAFGNVW